MTTLALLDSPYRVDRAYSLEEARAYCERPAHSARRILARSVAGHTVRFGSRNPRTFWPVGAS